MTELPPESFARAIEFRSPLEVESTRSDFDPACAISLESFAGIIGRCTFKEADRVLCQLEINDSVCRQEHGNGWLVKRKDGREGYIGKDCANRHFGADKSFARATSKARRELRIDALVGRLKAHLANADLERRITVCITRRFLLREKMQSVRDSLPRAVCTRLREMIKNRKSRVIVEFRRIDEKDNGDKVAIWEPGTIASVVGLGGLDSTKLHEVGERLRSAQSAVREAVPAPDQKESALREWVGALDNVEHCERDLEEITAALREFQQPQNYQAMCWIISSDRDQLEMIRLAGQLQGTKVGISEAHEIRKALHKAIRDTANGADFRVP